MPDKGADLDVVEVLLVDRGGYDRLATIPGHLELWMLLMDILCKHVDAFRIGIASHEGDTGDVTAILLHEAVDGLCVEGQSDILPEVVAVTTRAVTRAIRDINCQCHFVWYLLKYDACIDVLQHKAIGMVPLALNLGSLESCMGVESASGLLLTSL